MPDLYSNFRIFILLENYSNVAFECLNFVWFLVDLCRTLVQRTDRNEKSQSSLKLVIKTDHDRVSAAFFLWSETYLIASHCYYYSTQLHINADILLELLLQSSHIYVLTYRSRTKLNFYYDHTLH